MNGSLRTLASTLPVQWMLPVLGWRWRWRGVAVTGWLSLVSAGVWWLVSRDAPAAAVANTEAEAPGHADSQRLVHAHPAFWHMAPLGLFVYGGSIHGGGLGGGATGAAQGFFVANLSMLPAVAASDVVMPRLIRAGWAGERLSA